MQTVIVVMQNDCVMRVLHNGDAAERCQILPENVRRAIVNGQESGTLLIDFGIQGQRRVYWHWSTYEVVQ